jgi:hypothetical protein
MPARRDTTARGRATREPAYVDMMLEPTSGPPQTMFETRKRFFGNDARTRKRFFGNDARTRKRFFGELTGRGRLRLR